jgi:putative protease
VDQYTDKEDSLAIEVKRHAGIVIDYFARAGIAQVKIQDQAIAVGDHVQVHGATTGVVDLTIESLRRDDETLERAERGTWATFPCPRVRVGDKVFLMCKAQRTL